MTPEDYNIKSAKFDKELARLSAVIKGIVGDQKLPSGLTPDHIKALPEYQKAKQEFRSCFDKSRDWAKGVPNSVKREASKLRRRQKWGKNYDK